MTRAERVLAAVRERLAAEPESVLPVLELLAFPDALIDPEDEVTNSLARTVNEHRMVAALREIRERSYSTGEVAEMLGGVTRQAVSARVAKGQLMSIEISRRSYFPDWQFVRGRPAKGLRDVIAALTEIGEDTFSADALMRTPLPEEDGRTPADLLAAGDVERARHYVYAVGGGF